MPVFIACGSLTLATHVAQEHQYRLWRFGQLTLLIRCREHALQSTSTPGATGSTVVRVKLEYAPQLGQEVRQRC